MQQNSMYVGIPGKRLTNRKTNAIASSIVGYLKDFGLTEKEANAYYVMSKLGSATANELTSALQYNRLQTYRSIKGLLNRGLVEISLERPRRYTPLKIEHAISLLEQDAENRIVKLESKKPLLLDLWSQTCDFPARNPAYTFRIIQGTNNVVKFAIMLYESAKNKIDFIMTQDQVMGWTLEGIDDLFEKIVKHPVSIRAISEFNRENAPGVRSFMKFIDIRHSPALDFLPLVLVDNKEVLICLTNGGIGGLVENAIWTNHPQLVRMLGGSFDALWDSAKDGKLMVDKLDRKGQDSNSTV